MSPPNQSETPTSTRQPFIHPDRLRQASHAAAYTQGHGDGDGDGSRKRHLAAQDRDDGARPPRQRRSRWDQS